MDPAQVIAGDVEIDACLADEIGALNAAGIRTIGCCCGHGLPVTSGAFDEHHEPRDAAGGWIAVYQQDAALMDALGYVRRPAVLPNYAGLPNYLPRSLAGEG
jgi:hypothetical protein